MRYLRMDDAYFLQILTGKANDKLSDLEEGKRFLPVFIVGLIATITVWVVALSFPHTASVIYSSVVNSNLPRYGTLLCILAMVIPFAPPFVSVFALGNMIQRRRASEQLDSGVMSGFSYSQQSNQRWSILIAAAASGAINCLFLMIALLVVTGA